jgi:hypothetical protein
MIGAVRTPGLWTRRHGSDRAADGSKRVIAAGHGRGDSPGARALSK